MNSSVVKKITLATVAEEDMGDFSYLLEAYKELRKVRELDDASIELAVKTDEQQKQKFYKYFEETKNLPIRWLMDDQEYNKDICRPVDALDDSGLVLFLSEDFGLSPNFNNSSLFIQYYSDYPAPDKPAYEQGEFHLSNMAAYWKSVSADSQGSARIVSRDGDEEEVEEELEGLRRCEEKNSCFSDESQSLVFGLGERYVGMPFNSDVINKVAEYERHSDIEKTALSQGLRRLFISKPWLGEALAGYGDFSTQLQAIKAKPYYVSYHHEFAFLKEFLTIITEMDQSEPVMVINVSEDDVRNPQYTQLFKDLGFGVVRYVSKDNCQTIYVPDVFGGKTITIVKPGAIPSQEEYDALLFYSHSLMLVAGNLSLVKAISMNKVPFYEWRSFQQAVNDDLREHWKGTALEDFFQNRYAPRKKALALNRFGFDETLIKKVNGSIIKKHNNTEALADVVWLALQPDHPAWKYSAYVDDIVSQRDVDVFIKDIKSKVGFERDVPAAKLVFRHIKKDIYLQSIDVGELIYLIQDPMIKELMLMKIRESL
ncbi:hypothetical protein GZ77_13255 [Endozoicomonas montiporae]|uniref:Uncharacterized protein n=2 Tax=Endozoicomonas montiporae TaxID=1027273 RepID=A0A081N4J8_9GAMM|nr:hypothetical protein GZ77_13255 [Endozoicomonas montiporae]